jgi:hypothetical protein
LSFGPFWWKNELVGFGRYWWEARPYACSPEERSAALTVAREVAERVNVCFLVVDVAQTNDGCWIAIECNDGQESGYAGVSPVGLWQSVIDVERLRGEDVAHS